MRSLIGGMGVEEAVEPGLVVLERVVNAHGRGGVVELGEGLVVLLEFVEGADQAGRVAGELDAAHVGQLLAPARQGQADERTEDHRHHSEQQTGGEDHDHDLARSCGPGAA